MFGLVASLLLLASCERPTEAEEPAEVAAIRERYAKAEALFYERCKTAGLSVKRTVKDVEGIELSKLRGEIPWGGKEFFDPMFSEAAMAAENRGEDYVNQFLMTEFRQRSLPERRGGLGPGLAARDSRDLPPMRGYRFVEYVDSHGVRFRCVPTWRDGQSNWVTGSHRCDLAHESQTRYALDYEDLVEPSDRALWIAGTKLKVIDKQTGEVIAQLTRFVWDPGFGGSTTGRWPWQHANTAASTVCPSDPNRLLSNDSRYFVDEVLIPRQDD